MGKIVIDPGHGGDRTIPGDSTWNNAVGPKGTLEKNLALDIGLKVHAELFSRRHEVRLTRDSDVNLRLRDRAAVAARMKADAFISIHFNGSTHHNAQGTETLVHTNYSRSSAELSLKVQDALLPVTGLTDRNRAYNQQTRIKPQALGVLNPIHHYGRTAACLVEVSFLDRADEEERLQDDNYRTQIALAICDGVESYVGQNPILVSEFEDAVELAAVVAGTTVPAMFGLESDLLSPAEDQEFSEVPQNPFTRAFLEGTGPLISSLAVRTDDNQYIQDFFDFIASLRLPNFTADEFLHLGGGNDSGSCRGKNYHPPRELWPNIRNTALMLQEIRNEMGAAIRITSAYRSPEYNACLAQNSSGVASNSLHMRFNAVDFVCRAGTPEIWHRIATRLASENPDYRGQQLRYNTFVHIDTRDTL